MTEVNALSYNLMGYLLTYIEYYRALCTGVTG